MIQLSALRFSFYIPNCSPSSPFYYLRKVNVKIPGIVTVKPPGPPPSNPNVVSPHAAVSAAVVPNSSVCLSFTTGALVTIASTMLVFVEIKVLKGVALALLVPVEVGGQEVEVHGGKGRDNVTE